MVARETWAGVARGIGVVSLLFKLFASGCGIDGPIDGLPVRSVALTHTRAMFSTFLSVLTE
jgi:hypothetical protein